jgi:hypothetical protein
MTKECSPGHPQIYDRYRIDSGNRIPEFGTPDYSIITKNGDGFAFTDDGKHIMTCDGTSHENVGCNLPSQTSSNNPFQPAKWIRAESGDIVLEATLGTIYLTAKNIVLVASGSEPNGNIFLKSSNEIYIKSSDSVTIAATNVTVSASKTATLVGKSFTNIAANFSAIASTTDTFTLSSFLDTKIEKILTGLGLK